MYLWVYQCFFFVDASEHVRNLSVNPMGHAVVGTVTKLNEPVARKNTHKHINLYIYIIHINIYLYLYMFICRHVYHILCDFISFCGAFFFIGNYALSPHLTASENMTIFDMWKQLHLYYCGMPQVHGQQR